MLVICNQNQNGHKISDENHYGKEIAATFVIAKNLLQTIAEKIKYLTKTKILFLSHTSRELGNRFICHKVLKLR